MRVLGFMTGTSLDAIDMAVLEIEGDAVVGFGPSGEAAMPEALRVLALDAIQAGRGWARDAPEPNLFHHLSEALARAHAEAAATFLTANGLTFADIDLIGFHGQTVLHEAPREGRAGRTRQLGDGALLARLTGVRVAYDFRSADVAAGGHGAPLVPVFHRALAAASGLKPPLAVLNLGGVANATLIGSRGDDEALAAFDTGPGNGLIDSWVEAHGAGRLDRGGASALAGRVDAAALARCMAHPYFAAPAPKSLDRYDFDLAPVEGLTLEDGAATLAAFTAEAAALGLRQAGFASAALIVAGGGRRNPAILRELGLRAGRPVLTAEAVGWRGDAVEAQAFAYLAALSAAGRPLSFPPTTGVAAPTPGGVLASP